MPANGLLRKAKNDEPRTTLSSAAEIRTLFDRIAPVYDRLNDWLSLGQHRVWKRMAVKWANPRPGDVALDVCCGSGDLALLLHREVGERGRVIGADFAPAQLQIAAYRNPDIEWIEADALALPFADNAFDCATMGYGLRNVTDIPRSLGELYRVLKPGAIAAILDFHRPENAIARDFQQWYLDNLVVPIARHFGVEQDYAYIAPSLDRFPQGREQVQIAREVGFKEAVHYAIAGELMGVLVVTK